jgi:hypothetical protein
MLKSVLVVNVLKVEPHQILQPNVEQHVQVHRTAQKENPVKKVSFAKQVHTLIANALVALMQTVMVTIVMKIKNAKLLRV